MPLKTIGHFLFLGIQIQSPDLWHKVTENQTPNEIQGQNVNKELL